MYAEIKKDGEQDVAEGVEAGLALAQATAQHDVDTEDREVTRARRDDDAAVPPARPAPEAAALVAADQPASAKPGRSRRFAILALALLAGVSGGAFYGYHWWTVGRFTVSTDDAYVRAANTTLAAKLSGYVSSIAVADNAYVHAGDVIATIDDGDYRLAVEQARDKLATQQASVERIAQQVIAQQAAVEQAQAQLVSAQAGARRAESELARQQSLAARDYASKQTLEQALTNRDQAKAAVQSAEAALDAANATIGVLKAQQQEALRGANELKTALAKAERDLSFAVIRAPIDGVFGNRAIQTGDYVTPGQRLASIVPLDDVYIDANFKETQLAGLRPGQKVEFSVDAVPGRTIEGTVASLAPASGSVFSLLPPDNATGNFTKIVQRVPVRIKVPADIASQRVLRPGMSAVVSINTKNEVRSGTYPLALRATGQSAN